MSFNLIPPGQSSVNSAAAGVGGISSLLTSLTGAIGNSWDIDEGSYGHNGVQILFHVFKTAVDNFSAAVDSVQDNAGNRKIPLIFPYVDGQSTDHLGRKGESFDINILIFGPNYKAQYKKLIQEFVKPNPGRLIHPVRGIIAVVPEDWVVTHSSDKKQAVALRVRFIEHSFFVNYSAIQVNLTVPSALTAAIAFISQIAKGLALVQSLAFIASNTRNLVTALLSNYQAGYTDLLGQLNQTFNPDNSLSIPGLNPLVAGQSNQTFGVAASFSDVFSGTGALTQAQSGQSQQLTAALSTEQAIDSVRALRTSLESQIEQIEATEQGQGALIFYDQILLLKQSAQSMVDVLNTGIQTSKNTIITYMTPRDMSVREVCFANGLTPDDSYDVEVLNPQLLSMNLIPKGTIVQVPT